MIRSKPVSPASVKKLADLPEMLKACEPVEFAYLFGGAATGELKPLSDIDIAVYLAPSCDPSVERFNLLDRIVGFLGTDEIDLVILNTAPVSLTGRILLRRKLIYCGNGFSRHVFESLTLRKFFDFRVMEQRLLNRRFQRG